MIRNLFDVEKKAIVAMSQSLKPILRQRLLADLEGAQVEAVTKDGSRLLFHIVGYEREKYQGQHAYPCGGTVRDSDQEDISVAIYADHNDRLLEFELVKLTDTPITSPEWESFQALY